MTASSRGIWASARTFSTRIQSLPRKLGLAAAGLTILMAGGFMLSSSLSRSAKLNISCRHSLRSAELSVWLDGNLLYRGEVNGTARKRFGLFATSKVAGWSKSFEVPSGRHTVQVRLNAEAEGYDQIKTASVIFRETQDNSLSISQDRHALSLVSNGSAEAATEGLPQSSYQKYLSSIVLSIFGSGMSAVIGFLVQDFMRSQKGKFSVIPQPDLKN